MSDDETESPYCPKCDACGEEGCCPPSRCPYVDQYRGDYAELCDEVDRLMMRTRKQACAGPDGEPIKVCVHCGTSDVGWMKTSTVCCVKCRDPECSARMQCEDGDWTGLLARWNRDRGEHATPDVCDTAGMPPLDAAALGVLWHVQQAKRFCRGGNDLQAMGHATEAFRELGALVAALHTSTPKET